MNTEEKTPPPPEKIRPPLVADREALDDHDERHEILGCGVEDTEGQDARSGALAVVPGAVLYLPLCVVREEAGASGADRFWLVDSRGVRIASGPRGSYLDALARDAAHLASLRRYLSAMSRPSATAERLAAREAVHLDDLAAIEGWEARVNREVADLTAERDEARAEVEAIRAKLDEARRRMAVTPMASEAAPFGQAKGCRGCAHNDGRTVTCWVPRARAASDEIDAWAEAHLADDLLTPKPGAPECPGREVAP